MGSFQEEREARKFNKNTPSKTIIKTRVVNFVLIQIPGTD